MPNFAPVDSPEVQKARAEEAARTEAAAAAAAKNEAWEYQRLAAAYGLASQYVKQERGGQDFTNAENQVVAAILHAVLHLDDLAALRTPKP